MPLGRAGTAGGISRLAYGLGDSLMGFGRERQERERFEEMEGTRQREREEEMGMRKEAFEYGQQRDQIADQRAEQERRDRNAWQASELARSLQDAESQDRRSGFTGTTYIPAPKLRDVGTMSGERAMSSMRPHLQAGGLVRSNEYDPDADIGRRLSIEEEERRNQQRMREIGAQRAPIQDPREAYDMEAIEIMGEFDVGGGRVDWDKALAAARARGPEVEQATRRLRTRIYADEMHLPGTRPFVAPQPQATSLADIIARQALGGDAGAMGDPGSPQRQVGPSVRSGWGSAPDSGVPPVPDSFRQQHQMLRQQHPEIPEDVEEAWAQVYRTRGGGGW